MGKQIFLDINGNQYESANNFQSVFWYALRTKVLAFARKFNTPFVNVDTKFTQVKFALLPELNVVLVKATVEEEVFSLVVGIESKKRYTTNYFFINEDLSDFHNNIETSQIVDTNYLLV